MIQSLLVPFDSTDGARHALAQADTYAQRVKVPIDLLVVGSPGLEAHDRAELHFEADRLSSPVGDLLVLTGDDVADTIERCVLDRPSVQLWMATHGRSRIGGLVLGSAAEAIIHSSPRPTVLVGPHAAGRAADGPVALFVADLAPPPSLLAAAAWWSERLSCLLRVVIVTTSPGSPPARNHLLGEQLRRAGLTAEMDSLHCEDPAEAMSRYVEVQNVQLPAMTTHARSGIRRALAGTVTMAVVHRAPCPALVVAADNPSG